MNYESAYDDLINMLCGKELGSGISRTVFVCRLDPTWVVKIDSKNGRDQNNKEWMIWDEVNSKPKLRKWFAPCEYISNSGRILIQKRTEPVRLSDVPKKLPSFLMDQKLENYGMLDGQFVCHDYGSTVLTHGWSSRMRKHDFTPDF